MARIRTIKPEFWHDEKLGPLDPLTRLVFLGLISMADDEGRLLDSTKVIDAFLFPYTDDTSGAAVDELERLGRIQRGVTKSGQRVIQVLRWDHQKIDKPNRKAALRPIADASATNRRNVADEPSNHTVIPSYRHTVISATVIPTNDKQPAADAARPAENPMGEIMQAIRSRLYVPDGKPPVGWTEGRCASIAKRKLKAGTPVGEILDAIEGLALLRDRGELDWLKRGEKVTLRALYHTRSGAVPVWTLALNAVHDRPAVPRGKSKPEAISGFFKPWLRDSASDL